MNLIATLMANPQARAATVRLQTLIYLRWLAVLGQTVAVVIATEHLGIVLRIDYCAVIIGLSAALNIGQSMILPQSTRLNQRHATLTLFFDILQLAALLYLTGGLTNPFAALILAQTIIAATVLTLNATIFLAAVSLAVVAGLALFQHPMMTVTGEVLDIPPLLVTGAWAALSISIVFLGVYARIVSTETNNMSEALTATQLALEREQKLTALGGVVAAAAHELGTPLATIMLVCGELEDDLQGQPEVLEDVQLIRNQAERCRSILTQMGRSGKDDLHVRHAPFRAIVVEAAEPHMNRGKSVIVRVGGKRVSDGDSEGQALPYVARKPEIIHGVRNLVQNAVDFAASTVWIDIDWTDSLFQLRVGDDGRGYPQDLLGRIGDPFLRSKVQRQVRPDYQGMGLGLFIAKTLLERTGATLTFANGTVDLPPKAVSDRRPTGAIVEVVWTRSDIEVPRTLARGPLGENLPNVSAG
jgi:two-component system, sensor histidine kinase RegB